MYLLHKKELMSKQKKDARTTEEPESTTQVVDMREALRQALDEEMTRDDRVFIMGEEVGEYNGAYKVTKGMLDKWGPKRIIDTPIAELGFLVLASVLR